MKCFGLCLTFLFAYIGYRLSKNIDQKISDYTIGDFKSFGLKGSPDFERVFFEYQYMEEQKNRLW